MKCRRCELDKDLSQFYKSKRNKSGCEYICKPCKSIDINARRYGISESFLEYLYSHEQCMCCDEQFVSAKGRHIHHTDQGVQGLVCIHCNHILGQETEEDLQRIKLALIYMKSSRENLLDRDNQQERLRDFGRNINVVEESSETIRCESQMCSQCKRLLTKKSFRTPKGRGTLKVCFDCQRSNDRLLHSKQATEARNKASNCACCDCELNTKKCVHHVGDTVYGVVCHKCNQLLGDESEQRQRRLLVCKLWIEDNLSWDYDRVRPAWRHAECGRNDHASETVAL
jgi:hypothetical protein